MSLARGVPRESSATTITSPALGSVRLAVVVAVPVVRMVEVAGYDVVDVIAVHDRLMPTTGPVLVLGLVVLAIVAVGALVRLPVADLD
jgi:hypothetical protein